MSTGKVLLGVLAGAAAGALLGVLLAPDKGSVTRRKIAEKGEDYADALKEKFDELMGSMTERFNEVKEEAKHVAQNGKSKADEFRKDVKNAVG